MIGEEQATEGVDFLQQADARLIGTVGHGHDQIGQRVRLVRVEQHAKSGEDVVQTKRWQWIGKEEGDGRRDILQRVDGQGENGFAALHG